MTNNSFDFYVETEILVPNSGAEFPITAGLYGNLSKDKSLMLLNPLETILPEKYKIIDYLKVPKNKQKMIEESLKQFWDGSPRKIKQIIGNELGEFIKSCAGQRLY
jgi:hypothetical protein